MSLVATGYSGAAVENLRKIVSESTTFQKLVRAADAAAALSRVYPFAKENNPARPLAVATSETIKRIGATGGGKTHFHPAGKLFLLLEVPAIFGGDVSAVVSASDFTDASLAGHADDFFNGLTLKFLDGANEGEQRTILDFAGTTGQLTFSSAFPNAPSVADEFVIYPEESDALVFFLNISDAILEDIESKAGMGGYLGITNISAGEWGRARADQADSDDGEFFICKIDVEYGV